MTRPLDAVVVGAGPNGLVAAAVLARAGRSVAVLEAAPEPGGGLRSEALTLPGFVHDTCSTSHPFAPVSPALRVLPLAAHGLRLVEADAPLAHPLRGGGAAVLERSLTATAAGLGRDGVAYRRLMEPVVASLDELMADLLGPPRPPRHPVAAARFALRALRSAEALVRTRFHGEPARALLAGMAAHSMQPLDAPATAAFALVLGALAHAGGWPFAVGGSAAVARALVSYLGSLGVEVTTGRRVASLDELPAARAVLLDLTPTQVLAVAGARLPAGYRRRLAAYRHGPAAFKLDWALGGPVPWRDGECARAGVVHLGGGLDDLVASEAAPAAGRPPRRPFVIAAQAAAADPSRTPAGGHTLWAYCHVPLGSVADVTDLVEAQLQRFAPGFGDVVLARSVMPPGALQRHDANLVGGDINGGSADLLQLMLRPTPRLNPYATPNPGLFLCSSSTPPGGGVHGLPGMLAARTVLRRVR